MEFLTLVQLFSGATLTGKPGSTFDLPIAIPVWSGFTALGVALLIIGKRRWKKAAASDNDDFKYHIDNFH
jgi:hypothetical protein